MIASLVLAVALGAGMTVDLAPDQPLPFVYVDEPLILELHPSRDLEAAVRLRLTPPGAAPEQEIVLPSRQFRRDTPFWWAIDEVPPLRGHFQVTVHIEGTETATATAHGFCRIDRPGPGFDLPLTVQAPGAAPGLLLAMDSIGVGQLRADATGPDFTELVNEGRLRKWKIAAVLPGDAGTENMGRVQTLAERFGGEVARWDILAQDDPEAALAVAKNLRDTGAAGAVAFVVDTPAAARALFEAGIPYHVRDLVLRVAPPDIEADLAALHALQHPLGIERWRTHVHLAAPPSEDDAFAQVFLRALAAGARSVIVETAAVYETALPPAFAAASGLRRRVNATRPVGVLPVGENATALVFRDHDAWLAALWAEHPQEVSLPVGAAENLELGDALNNPLICPSPVDGTLTLEAGPLPLLLSGQGGGLVAHTAALRSRALARAFADNADYRAHLPPELVEQVRELTRDPAKQMDRTEYLALVRHFPALEAAWRAGTLPGGVAGGATADLAALARALAAVLDGAGERFLSPLTTQLETCRDQRAPFLNGGEVRPRGAWLLDEVLHLMHEAEALHRSGREIEATAVAALAEWRARALRYAASADDALTVAGLQVASETATRPEVREPADEEPAAEEPIDEEPAREEPAEEETVEEEPVEAEPDEEEPAAEETEARVHVVQRGDNLSNIAGQYGVSLDELLEWNNLSRRSVLRIGQELRIHAPAEEASAEEAPAPRQVTHRVRAGENPSIIAGQYGVGLDEFLEWNNLTRRSTLHIGDEYIIHLPPE